MKKVLMVLETNFPPDVRVKKEIDVLSASNYIVYLLCSTRDKNALLYEKYKDNVFIYRVYQTKIYYKFSALALLLPFYFSFWKKKIDHFLQNHSVDLIHIHDLPLLKLGVNISQKHNLKLIIDYHENRPEIMRYYSHVNKFPGNILISLKKWKKYEQKYTRYTDAIIVVTKEAKKYYSKVYGWSTDKIYVIPNYVDIKEQKQIKIDSQIVEKYKNKFSFVYLGNTGERRGTIDILEAAKKLKGYKKIHFIIIGNSSDQKYLEKFKEKNDLANVEIMGWIEYKTAMSYMAASKVGLSPLKWNLHHETTYANKIFQYMYYGKPIIVSDCKAQKIIAGKYNCGLIHEPGNSDDLTKKILNFYQMSEREYTEFSVNAKRAVDKDLNFEWSGKELRTLYEDIFRSSNQYF